MNGYFQLPGQTEFQLLTSPKRRPDGKPKFFVILLVEFCTAAYLYFRYAHLALGHVDPKDTALPATAAKPAGMTISVAQGEDLLFHLQAADARAFEASADIQKSEAWMARISPALEREYLSGEKQRLDAAETVLESARRAVEAERQQLEIVRNLIAQRSENQ